MESRTLLTSAAVSLQLQELAGDTTPGVITVGEEFDVHFHVEDTVNTQAVFSGYADVEFDASYFEVVGDLTYDTDYSAGQTGTTDNETGLIDELGASALSFTPPNETQIASIRFRAKQSGTSIISTNVGEAGLSEITSFDAGLSGDLRNDTTYGSLSVVVAGSEPSVELSVSPTSIAEAAGAATVTATLSETSTQDVTVDLAFSGTATLSSDYMRTGTQIVIPAGSTSGTVTVTAVQDSLDEADETIVVDISSVTNGTELGTQQVTTTITDDDVAPSVTLGISPATIAEATGSATLTATLSAVSGNDVTVNLAFSGIATLTDDYTRTGTQIVIPAGQTAGSVTVTSVQDSLDEADEMIVVDINSVTNGIESGTQQVTTTIIDDDDPVGIDQPVLHYTFDTDATDSSVSGLNGTITGSPVFETVAGAGVVTFNNPAGSSVATEYVTIPDNSILQSLADQSFTVAIRYLSTDAAQTNGRLFGNGNGGANTSGIAHTYNRGVSASSATFLSDGTRGFDSFPDADGNAAAITTDGEFHWAVTTVDRANGLAKTYVDDVLISAVSIVDLQTVSFNGISIGRHSSDPKFGARGTSVDDFRIYDQALSPAEVLELVAGVGLDFGDAPVPYPTANDSEFAEFTEFADTPTQVAGTLDGVPFTITINSPSNGYHFFGSTFDNSSDSFSDPAVFTPASTDLDSLEIRKNQSSLSDTTLVIEFAEPVVDPTLLLLSFEDYLWDFSATAATPQFLSGNDQFQVVGSIVRDVTGSNADGTASGSVRFNGTFTSITAELRSTSADADLGQIQIYGRAAAIAADDGAAHVAVGPTLGATRDSEPNGIPSQLADSDGADEDGVTFGVIVPEPAASYSLDGSAVDASGSADGVLTGDASFVTLPDGRQALSTSSGSYVAIPEADAFKPGNSSFSASLQFRLEQEQFGLTFAPLLTIQGGDFSEGAILSVSKATVFGDVLALSLHDGSASQVIRFDSNVSLLDAWHDVSYTVDRTAGLVSLYLDGHLVAAEALTVGSIDPSQDLLLGQYDFGFARNGLPRFVGGQGLLLDDVRIFDDALSAAQVATLAGTNTVAPGSIRVGDLGSIVTVNVQNAPSADYSEFRDLNGLRVRLSDR
ncbi:MAG: hypothetical protein HQ518_23135 [Rhodopirellula sp.]|nr:hypothetical protein [Rhodopirellula sp.]